MAHLWWFPVADGSFAAPLSRRAMLRMGGALGLSVVGLTAATTRSGLAALSVTVAAPTIEDIEECIATISVAVTFSVVAPGRRYEAYGDILEADEQDGDHDFCCALDPRSTPAGDGRAHVLHLTRRAMATDLGLLRGQGPASDESSRPERVQLFARIWLREFETGDRFGPWESPRLIAVPNPRLVWTPRQGLLGSELVTTRGEVSFSSYDSIGLRIPPEACRSWPRTE